MYVCVIYTFKYLSTFNYPPWNYINLVHSLIRNGTLINSSLEFTVKQIEDGFKIEQIILV